VAGFAEGRREIDGEFIDTVIAAQGGSLEGTEEKATLASEDLVSRPEASEGGIPASSNGLEATVVELSARLTRLEGLVLEMTSQLVPVLSKFLSKPLSPEPAHPSEDIMRHPAPAEEEPHPENQPQVPKSWWSRLWEHG
jgi:hypothetical protein